MPYNTNNPVGSTDPRDLYDNAGNLDKFVNGDDPFYPDRLGKQRLSYAGMERDFKNAQDGRSAEFDAFLESSAFIWIGDYGAGLTFTSRSQYMVRDGSAYRLATTTTIPYTTTGNWSGEQSKFALVNSDNILRQDLLSTNISEGAANVGRSVRTFWGFDELRANAGQYHQERVSLTSAVAGWADLAIPRPLGGGEFVWNSGSTADDDGGTVFAVAGVPTGRWIRQITGRMIEAIWWGEFTSTAINSAVSFAYANSRLRTVHLCGGNWEISQKIALPTADLHLIGDEQFTTRLTAQAGLDYIIDIGDGTTFIDNVSVKSLTLNGGYVSSMIAHIRSRRCQKKFTIHNIECMDGAETSAGLLVTEGWGLSLTNNHFYFCGRALDLSGVNAAQIVGNYCWNTSRENLVLANTSNALIASNAFEHWGKAGVGSYYNVNFSGNCFANRFNANWLESGEASNSALNIGVTSTHNSVEQNTIYCASGVGHLVYVRGDSNVIRHNRLSISNASYAHVRVETAANLNDVGDNYYGGSSTTISDGTNGNYFGSMRYVYRVQSALASQTIANGAGVTLPTISVPNAQVGMHVSASLNVSSFGCRVFGWMSATGMVTVRIENNTGGSQTISAGLVNVHVEQH
ncbi:hypothetical protein [Pseudomonas guariconensis]|uniref:hypothetical protein n=1 Tax=Pseudomonas guariconensis TaxID=1288410 RepID=UPI0018D5DFF3|nr:hypothetical protein [Pseudomonas guariconensis]MBH3360515.1 hypothetical protein [Pseudomonas guariconensis]